MKKYILIASLVSSFFAYSKSSWQEVARGLFSENNEKIAKTKKDLLAYPSLVKELKGALKKDEDKDLALQVIAAIKSEALIPDLLEIASVDRLGKVDTVLFTLRNDKNKGQIDPYFMAQIPALEKDSGAGKKIFLLGILSKLSWTPDQKILDQLLGDKSYEVRLASAQMITSFFKMPEKEKEFFPLWKKLLTISPSNIRQVALYCFEALSKDKQKTYASELSICLTDKNEEVKNQCMGLKKSLDDDLKK